MKKKSIWFLCLPFLFGVIFWLLFTIVYDLYTYFVFNEYTFPLKIQTLVQEDKQGRCFVEASYEYMVGSQSFKGKMLFKDLPFYNSWTAEEFVEDLKNKEVIKIWYNQINPINSTIDRSFPLKSIRYSLILTFLLIYFVCLCFMIRKKTS